MHIKGIIFYKMQSYRGLIFISEKARAPCLCRYGKRACDVWLAKDILFVLKLCGEMCIFLIVENIYSGYPLHRENVIKDSLSGKTQGIWKFCQNTGNLVCPSCKFSQSKDQRYFNICRENYPNFVEAG